jgi:ribosomal protein S18 acetylase RimI-like enzyme
MSLIWKESVDEINWQELADLYKVAPLGDKTPAMLKVVFSNSMFRCFVYEGALLVGVGRALADGADCSYICDVAVLPTHQGTGIGKAIMSRLIAQSSSHRKIILYSVPDKEAFYGKLGFKRMTTAMAIFQDPDKAALQGYICGT